MSCSRVDAPNPILLPLSPHAPKISTITWQSSWQVPSVIVSLKSLLKSSQTFYAVERGRNQAQQTQQILLVLEENRASSLARFQTMEDCLTQIADAMGFRLATNPSLGGIIIVDPFGHDQVFAKLPGDPEVRILNFECNAVCLHTWWPCISARRKESPEEVCLQQWAL